jgi:hypothetical protein
MTDATLTPEVYGDFGLYLRKDAPVKEVTHTQMAGEQAFQKVEDDMKRCFETWKQADIAPSLALWALTAFIAESVNHALNDRTKALEFIVAAAASVLIDAPTSVKVTEKDEE